MRQPYRPLRKTGAPRRIAAPFSRHLVVMVKAPVAGRVKTRLARGAGVAAATRFYRATTGAVLDRLGRTGRWTTWLAVTPDDATAARWWPKRIRRIGQGRGDLGARMQRVFDRLPTGPVVIVGTDIPEMRASDIAMAFRRLDGADAVLGPAPDGGYWLVGLRRSPRVPRPFAGVRWSSPDTLTDTLAGLEGHKVEFAATLSDVDEAADVARISAWLGRRVAPSVPGRRSA